MARKSKLNVITDNIDQIKKWKELGVTDEQISKQLGIALSTYSKHLSDNPKLQETIKTSVVKFVVELKGELARQSFKHTLETKKQYVKVDIETGHKTQYTEITTKEVDGNIGAIHLLLKNMDRGNWAEDWSRIELKKQELELRKQLAEDKIFN